MACSNCPSTVAPTNAKSQRQATVIRTTARNYTEEQSIIAAYPGYSVQRHVLGSNSVVLTLTKR